MKHANTDAHVKQPKRKRTIAIVGNMNVGKTTLFARLCGSDINSFSLMGNSVMLTRGIISGVDVEAIDTPGTCSIFAENEDERISRELLMEWEGPGSVDGALLVADAKHLKRAIALALQYREYGVPLHLVVNMIDEAEAHGIRIDTDKLSDLLGIGVTTTVATEGLGVATLKSKLGALRSLAPSVTFPQEIEEFMEIVQKLLAPPGHRSIRGIALLLLANDTSTLSYIQRIWGEGMRDQLISLAQEHRRDLAISIPMLLTNLFCQRAQEIVSQVLHMSPSTRSPWVNRLGDWCVQVNTGVPLALLVVVLMYLFVGGFGASFLVDLLHGSLFEGVLIPLCNKAVAVIPVAFVRDIMMDSDFGILPTGIFLALGLVLPVLLCFYVFFGFLEDSGYLPRISILLDRVFRRIGLNGKGVMPLVMGFSCITMAILTTRMLDTRKERQIATLLLVLGIPCAPLLGVLFIILEKMSIMASVMVFGVIVLQIFAAGLIANRIIPGKRAPLLIEIPPMRIPHPWRIIRRALLRTHLFMKEAVPVFVLASMVVFLFARVGGLQVLEEMARPIMSGMMGLPEHSVQVFIKTLIRKESGAAELIHLGGIYTNTQLITNILVLMFFLPCINAMIVIFKEHRTKSALVMLGVVMTYAIILGTVVSHACQSLGITFG